MSTHCVFTLLVVVVLKEEVVVKFKLILTIFLFDETKLGVSWQTEQFGPAQFAGHWHL